MPLQPRCHPGDGDNGRLFFLDALINVPLITLMPIKLLEQWSWSTVGNCVLLASGGLCCQEPHCTL